MKTDLKTPLKTSSTSDFAQEHADRLLQQLAFQIARAAKSAGADEVHDLRVAIRRFKAVLKALKPCFPGQETQKISFVLKKIMTLAGEVRDPDIGVELIAKVSGAAAAPLVVQFEVERNAAAKDLTDSLQVLLGARVSIRWHKMLHKPLAQARPVEVFCSCPIDVTAVRMLPKIAGKHYKRGERAAGEKTTADQLHQFRIATKKFRYTLDLFAPLYGESIGALVAELKGIQTLLGEINDYETIRNMVRGIKPRTDDTRRISADIATKLEEKAAEFREHWPKTFTAERVGQWSTELQQAAGKR